jgi:hypothetical protein
MVKEVKWGNGAFASSCWCGVAEGIAKGGSTRLETDALVSRRADHMFVVF